MRRQRRYNSIVSSRSFAIANEPRFFGGIGVTEWMGSVAGGHLQGRNPSILHVYGHFGLVHLSALTT